MNERKELISLLGRANIILENLNQTSLFAQVDSSDLSDKAEKLVDLIEKKIRFYDFYYYEKNQSLVSDSDYDRLKFTLEEIFRKFPNLKKENSSVDKVGSLSFSHFYKEHHINRMLSLSNAFNEDEVIAWYDRVKKNLDYINEVFVSIEPKIDGLSLSIQYKDGKLYKAITRGNGEVGEDVTENVKLIRSIPQSILNTNFIDVRGEVYISKSNFLELGDGYSTPRNAASGLLRQKKPKNMDKLNFFAYSAILESYDNYKNHTDIINLLSEYGFNIIPQLGTFLSLDLIFSIYGKYSNNRYQLDYDVDGLVLKINDISYQEILGSDSRAPRWALAYKFPSSGVQSIIKDIQVQVGRLGTLTPVAILEPVNIGGVFINKATLHNEDYISENDIRIGDLVLIERAGDIIPQIVKSYSDQRDPSMDYKIWQPNDLCPSCGSLVQKENVYRRCINKSSCSEQNIALIKHFVSKNAFDIYGLGDKTIRKFYSHNLLKCPSDIFDLKHKITSQKDIEHFCKLFSSIEKKRKISLSKFIYALGIPNIGRVVAKSIASLYVNNISDNSWFSDMLDVDNSKIRTLEGIGEVIIDSLKKYFSDEQNVSEIKKLLDKIEINNSTNINRLNDKLKDQVVVFTGTLNKMSRKKASEIALSMGARVIDSLNKNVTILVYGDNSGSKLEKARKLNIQMLSDEEWMNLIS